jgi:glycosyltransferase involved in cell wall biosynthesis
MKILHVGPIKPTRAAAGANHSIRGWAAAQAKIGLEVGFLPSLALPAGVQMEEIRGVCQFESPHKPHYNPWFISQDFVRQIQTEFGTPDLVNFHSTYIPFNTALARRCRRLGWPYIITPHGGMTYLAQSIKHFKKTLGNLTAFRSYVKHATAIHALSPREAKEAQDLFDVRQVFIVPNGVEDELFGAPEILSPMDLGDFGNNSDLVLGYVGRIDVYIKGLDLLLEALSKVKEKLGKSRCKLLMMGPFHTKRDKEYIVSTIKKLGLQDMVKLLGPKYEQEKWSYFLACDACVQTSRSEGMPMSVLEAMALGRACLVTPKTNMADVVGECGGWVCKAEADSIADAIIDIHSAKASWPAIGKRLQDVVRQRFTWTKVAQKLKAEYAKILQTG